MTFNVCKYFDWKCTLYISEVFEAALEGILTLRNTNHKLVQFYHKTPFIASSTWSIFPEKLKRAGNLSTFKHNLKGFYFDKSRN